MSEGWESHSPDKYFAEKKTMDQVLTLLTSLEHVRSDLALGSYPQILSYVILSAILAVSRTSKPPSFRRPQFKTYEITSRVIR